MIVTGFNPKHGQVSLTIESADDLWTLRRLISKGDVVVTRSSRVVKKEDEYSRPDKGERVKVTIALSVAEVHLDSSIERIRVKGTIVEASDETVTKAGSHAVTLSPGHSLTLRKVRWTQQETQLVRSPQGRSNRFVLVAADRREAGLGALVGSHLTVLTTIESGLGGKMSQEQSPGPYLSRLSEAVKRDRKEGDTIALAGPGNFKNAIANQLRNSEGLKSVQVLEGLDLTGADGVRAMVKLPSFQELAKGSVAIEMQRLVAEVVKRVSSNDPRVAYSVPRVKLAAEAGAVEACAASDNVFAPGVDEQEIVDIFNTVEEKGGSVYLADSSMEYGKQVSSFGGIVALLRYPLRTW